MREVSRSGPAIEFDQVSFRHPGGPPVLSDFSCRIERGETLVLVGRSGMGKTTILKLINRLLLPDAGRVLVEGRSTTDWDPIRLRRHIGYVLQEVGLFPHMTIGENVAVVPRLEGWPVERIRARTLEVLCLVGLDPETYRDRFPNELSGGQRQRVGVARALALDPPILLMDEPFGALDPLTRAEMHREFHRIQSQVRKTIVCVTHDMGEAVALGTRLGVLAGGRLAALASPAEIARSSDPEVRIFLDAMPLKAVGASKSITDETA
ncbi:MAG: ATP-binding cassette domain-containing protein [Acidobacteriota bacterium]|nr:MAG: ATP-binding cassette domain-containing protein [Acidobacteriota bacterium]